MTFDWGNESSIEYDVCIMNFGTSGSWTNESAGSEISIVSDILPRRAEQYVYGIRQDVVQQFNITIGSKCPKSRAEVDRILAWLVRPEPQWLVVEECASWFYRYKGFFTNPELISVGNWNFGYSFTFISTSPYAYAYPQKRSWDITNNATFQFNNTSGDRTYLYPTVKITPRANSQSFSITNRTDSTRKPFTFTFAAPFPNGNETITINNKLQIIQSSISQDYSYRRLGQFNLGWLGLLRGINEIQVTGSGKLKFEYIFSKRIGA